MVVRSMLVVVNGTVEVLTTSILPFLAALVVGAREAEEASRNS